MRWYTVRSVTSVAISPLTEANAVLPGRVHDERHAFKMEIHRLRGAIRRAHHAIAVDPDRRELLVIGPRKIPRERKNFARPLNATAPETITTARISGNSVTQNGYCAAAGHDSGVTTSSTNRGSNAGGFGYARTTPRVCATPIPGLDVCGFAPGCCESMSNPLRPALKNEITL